MGDLDGLPALSPVRKAGIAPPTRPARQLPLRAGEEPSAKRRQSAGPVEEHSEPASAAFHRCRSEVGADRVPARRVVVRGRVWA
jgi:hypothetical protein